MRRAGVAIRQATEALSDHVVFRAASHARAERPAVPLQWAVVTDAAFGGRSSGSMDNETGAFAGEIAQADGYAAVQATLVGASRRVGDYAGAAVRLRTDGRAYALNVTPESYLPLELYQGFIVAGASREWVEAELPWERFALTARGFVKEEQREFDTEFAVRVGVSVGGKGSKPGPFRLDVAEVRWVYAVGGADP